MMADEVFDLDIQNEGLREQLKTNLDLEGLKKYCQIQINSQPQLDKRAEVLTKRLVKRLEQSNRITGNK